MYWVTETTLATQEFALPTSNEKSISEQEVLATKEKEAAAGIVTDRFTLLSPASSLKWMMEDHNG